MKKIKYLAITPAVLLSFILVMAVPALADPVQYSLTIATTVGGAITEPHEPVISFDEGTVIVLIATPDVGYRFVEWTGDVDTIADVHAATTNITMNADYFLTANFAKQYDLTISSTEGGSVTEPGEGMFTCDEGTAVDLVATPDEGYRFDEWTGDVDTIADVHAATTNITMNDDYSIIANFVKQYELTTSSTEGGSVVEPGEGVFTYDEGIEVDLVATPDEGYLFDEWTGDVGTTVDVYAAATTITMDGDYSITANFEISSTPPPGGGEDVPDYFVKQYELITSSTEGGSVVGPGEGVFTYDEGAAVDLIATPGEYYRFVEWTGDVGTIVDVYAAATTITVNGDYSITANFEISSTPPPWGSRNTAGCFIATAAYGTSAARQIDVLREFRDVVLLKSTVGSQFVSLYYQISPPIADFIAGNEPLRILVRELVVDPIVWIVEATGDIRRN